MSFKKILILNFKISAVAGIIGFLLFLVFSPIGQKNDANYNYWIYNGYSSNPEYALIVKRKSNIEKLNTKKPGSVLYTGKDVFYLSKINRAWILDTLEGGVVKFKAKITTHDSSTAVVRGYTLIENVHPQE